MARPLRIVVIDSEYRYSVGGSLCRGFLALGHDAWFFDQRQFTGGWVDESKLRRLVHTAIRPATSAVLNLAIVTAVLARKPDVVFVMKGYQILPETIDAMRRAAKVIVSFQADDLENPVNTTEAMRRSIPLWDVLFSPRRFVGDELRARGVRRWEHLPFGYDPLISYPAPNATPPEPVDNAVVFAGAWAPERVELLEALVTRFPVKVWGSSWGRLPESSPLSSSVRKRQILDDALCAVLTQGGASVGLLRKANRDLHQMRTFEVPACAGFMLTERTADHLEWFEEGKEAVYFDGAEELVAQVERYLPDQQARRAIAEAGHRRLLADHHRYQDRAARIVEVVSELL